MEDIIEEYGEAILLGISAVILLGAVLAVVATNMPSFVQQFAKTLCG